jgi:hypothetical protein
MNPPRPVPNLELKDLLALLDLIKAKHDPNFLVAFEEEDEEDQDLMD